MPDILIHRIFFTFLLILNFGGWYALGKIQPDRGLNPEGDSRQNPFYIAAHFFFPVLVPFLLLGIVFGNRDIGIDEPLKLIFGLAMSLLLASLLNKQLDQRLCATIGSILAVLLGLYLLFVEF